MSDEHTTAPANEGSALDLTGRQSRRDFLKKAGLGTAAAAAVWVVPQVTSVGAQRAYAATTGPCVPRVIDFEGYSKGDKITNQIPGMTVSAKDKSDNFKHAMIFDSANPTGNDWDLGTPNEDFAGPGVGTGGDIGSPGVNDVGLGKVLIISEDGSSSDPDDNAGGGTITFKFDNPVSIGTVKILDIDNETSNIKVYSDENCSVQVGPQVDASDLGNNSVQTLTVNQDNIRCMEIYFSSSGAVAEFVCPCPPVSRF